MKRYFILTIGLLFTLIAYAEDPIIIFKTKKAVGDTISLGIKGRDFLIEGTEEISRSNWLGMESVKYKLTSQTVTITGKVQEFECATDVELVFLDVSKSSGLEILNCSNNRLLESIDVSQNKNLRKLYLISTGVTTIDVSGNSKLESLYGAYNQMTSLDLTQNTNLKDLNVLDNQIESLDLSNNPVLESIQCESNPLKDLKLSNNEKLTEIYCDETLLTSIDVSGCSTLKVFNCSGCQLEIIDVSKNLMLREFDCSRNQLENLNVSNNKELFYFSCSNNPLSQLDISENIQLITLNCNHMNLSTLDLSENRNLTSVSCFNNRLKNIVLNANQELRRLYCHNNELTSLDVSDTYIPILHLWGNRFSACGLDSLFNQLREIVIKEEPGHLPKKRLSIDLTPGIFIKAGEITNPGADGCREYIATNKNWDVLDLNSNTPINNAGYYVCGESGTSTPEIEALFSIYPNPVYDRLNVESDRSIKSITLYSLAGELCEKVRPVEQTDKCVLDLSDYPVGMYIVWIETSGGIRTQKIIKK